MDKIKKMLKNIFDPKPKEDVETSKKDYKSETFLNSETRDYFGRKKFPKKQIEREYSPYDFRSKK